LFARDLSVCAHVGLVAEGRRVRPLTFEMAAPRTLMLAIGTTEIGWAVKFTVLAAIPSVPRTQAHMAY
jgi:hypothetical protein